MVGPVTCTHRLLIDELCNNAHIFYMKGDLSFRVNEARKYKEDAHRLHAGSGSEVIYYVPKPVKQCRIYGFSTEDTTHLQLAVSENGRNFMKMEPEFKNISTGSGEYDYLFPVYYAIRIPEYKFHYIQIKIKTSIALSRVEIIYGGK